MLSIVHLSNNDINGGAARAAYRIHRCIEDNKSEYLVNSSMKVVKKYSSDPTVTCLKNNYLIIFETTPAPIVRPPSLMANLIPCSIATGQINSPVIFILSPGITISTFDPSSDVNAVI